MFKQSLVVIFGLLGIVGFLTAQAAPDRAQVVQPWITEDTVFVAMINLEGLDLDAVSKWVNDAAVKALEPEDLQEAQRNIGRGLLVVRGMREELKTAGVKDVYWLFEASPHRGEQVCLVFPAGANSEAVAAKLRPMIGRRMEVFVEQNAAVLQLEGKKDQRKPTAARVDLAAALAGRDAPVVVAFSLPQELRAMLPQELPNEMGGGELSPIQDGFMWALAELRFTPEPAIRAIAQMDGAANAQAASDLLATFLDAAAKHGRGAEGIVIAALRKSLTPSVKDDLLVVDLTSAKLNEAVNEFAPLVRKSRQRAMQIHSASQMRQLLMAIQVFAGFNKGAAPDQLSQIEKYVGGPQGMNRMMRNPQRPQKNPGYIYVKQDAVKAAEASEKVQLYEAYDTWPGGINVGYADGHVEWIAEEAAFLAQLKASGGTK